MLRRKLFIFALLGAMALVATACPQQTPEDGDGAVITLNIGAVLPLTGDLSDFGPAETKAVEIAIDVFNEAAEAAGSNIRCELVGTEDSQTDAAAGVEGARRLVDTQDATVIIGGGASSVTIAIAESVTIPGGILQFTPSGTSGDITTLEDEDLVWRTPPSDENQAPILASFVFEELGEGPISFGARNDAYGKFIIEGVVTEYELLGGTTTGDPVLWDPEAPTFTSEAGRIVAGDPTGFVLVDFPGTWQKMSPALVQTDAWDPALTFSADGLKVSRLGDDPPSGVGAEAANGMRGTAPGGVGEFDALWTERAPDVQRETFDAHAFDAAVVPCLGAVAADSIDTEGIKGQLIDISGPGGEQFTFETLEEAIAALMAGDDIDYEGASGPINFDENGDPQSEGAIYELYEFADAQLNVLRQVRVGEGENGEAG